MNTDIPDRNNLIQRGKLSEHLLGKIAVPAGLVFTIPIRVNPCNPWSNCLVSGLASH